MMHSHSEQGTEMENTSEMALGKVYDKTSLSSITSEDGGEGMSLIPWKYNNPRVNYGSMEVIHLPLSSTSITLYQDTAIDIDATQNTAYKVWDGAFLLAKHLENRKYFPDGYFSTKNCIELGAGCGLVSLSVWLLGGRVIATDLQECLPHTEKCVQCNVKRVSNAEGQFGEPHEKGSCDCLSASKDNSEHILADQEDIKSKISPSSFARRMASNRELDPAKIQVLPYRWGTDISHLSPPCDVILASDVVYHPDLVNDLIMSFDILSHSETTVLLSYKPRALGEALFFDKLEPSGYKCTLIPKTDHPEEFADSEYDLYHISKKL